MFPKKMTNLRTTREKAVIFFAVAALLMNKSGSIIALR